MSFGVSPSDVIKLVEFSTRVYVAFKDANDNSEAQVEGLVREFSAFHHCLLELDELMKEYGKPLPFPYLDFRETLKKCETTLEPYSNHLVDNRRMTFKKFLYTIKYIGKEKEIDGLRKQINGHYQALHMCISFLQLRLHLEATKQTQRLLDSTPFRSISFSGQTYTNGAFAGNSRPSPHALPPPSEAEQLYKDWQVFNRWLKSEDDRVALEAGHTLSRPLSLGDSPAIAPSGDAETAAVLYHLRRELEDAILIEENRAKRVAVEKRTNLSPSDAVRQEIRTMPNIPQRTFTVDTDFSGNFSRFHNPTMIDSTSTLLASPIASPNASPRIDQGYFHSIDYGSPPLDIQRSPSVSTAHTDFSTSPESRFSVSQASTVGTTPEDRPLRSQPSASSIATFILGEGALSWNVLCNKVEVERSTTKSIDSRKCSLHWRYREDHGLSIRAVYKDDRRKVQTWTTQQFPATGPSIPLTTSYCEGNVSIDFPRKSYGRLDKGCTDIKYTCRDSETAKILQTLLYTNNRKDQAELLFDRSVMTISSDKNKPECRNKNLRLWRKTELQEGLNGMVAVEVLFILFYTSALAEDRGHWVEEPHYVFQWLDESVYKKSSEKLTLIFSKEPGKWTRHKLFKGARKSSRGANETSSSSETALTTLQRQPTVSSMGTTFNTLQRQSTVSSVASSAMSIKSSKSSIFGGPSRISSLNRFGYSELEIKFQNKTDRKDFVNVWKEYVKPLGGMDEK
ncbi:hypothetical protein P154DRAFT_96034 [Amniculicola lignicola CBS 123094]|uniref:Fungal N-terminal domain-containing protein n=1 Tax=Amniculicola lignicola CBS 123094 TaxID=1392246 RepID=A0A6A5WNP9_9PLEO|nr:hypothetical protein P154DRAFT_96034 [Amniculicola lignicola CBS 123094]